MGLVGWAALCLGTCTIVRSFNGMGKPRRTKGSWMKKGVYVIALASNIAALFCILNPWFEDWASQGVVFLVLEVVFLLCIGISVFIYHLKKRLSKSEAMTASLDSVLSCLGSWI